MIRKLLCVLGCWLVPTVCGLLLQEVPFENKKKKERGVIILVGGGRTPLEARHEFVRLAGGRHARIVVIPTASKRLFSVEEERRFWGSFGVESVTVLHTLIPAEANSAQFCEPLNAATGVWIGGGDQGRLTAAYRGTAVQAALRFVLERGGVIGGTSAGASVVSEVMIYGDTESRGLGLLPAIIVDQHFDTRKRLGRLLGLLEKHRDLTGIGIDESTAILLTGCRLRVVGQGSVHVCVHGLPQIEIHSGQMGRLPAKSSVTRIDTLTRSQERNKP